MVDREQFNLIVKEALDDLHNPVRIQSSPLVDLLFAVPPDARLKLSATRDVFTEALDCLSPRDDHAGPFAGLACRLLVSRYLRGQSRLQICTELGVSQATYYRIHNEALDAVTQILWERYQRVAVGPTGSARLGPALADASGASPSSDAAPLAEAPGARHDADSTTDVAREELQRLAQGGERSWLDLAALLEGVTQTLQPLARRDAIQLRLSLPEALPSLYEDAIVLRQGVLNMVVESIGLSQGDTLELSCCWQSNRLTIGCGPLADGEWRRRDGADEAFAVTRGMLAASGRSLDLVECAPSAFTAQFDVSLSTANLVLAIDDDEDTTDLYRRFLQPYDYDLLIAQSGAEAWNLLNRWRPGVILLDVLMPREDGWDILQRLKTYPETADIPVVICSVLIQPQLALVLGASKVLRKPLNEEQLLATLRELKVGSGSADQ